MSQWTSSKFHPSGDYSFGEGISCFVALHDFDVLTLAISLKYWLLPIQNHVYQEMLPMRSFLGK